MTKKRMSSIRHGKRQSKRSQTSRHFDWNRVLLWFGLIQVALFSVIFLAALIHQDTELMDKALSVLIFAVKLTLQAENKK